jgi:predicted lipoprotein with Yx(FWY)xxD motif
MTRLKKLSLRAGGAAAVVGVALAVAACGGSSSSYSAPASPSKSSSSPAAGVSIATTNGPMGTYLTGASGRALYLWVADKGGKSACSGACASTWPPLTTSGTPTGSGGAVSSDLATITRSDGTKQVTYKGHPLYYYSADTSAGKTTGQGSNQFGAKWWLVAPSGSGITSGSSSGSGSSGSASAGYSRGSSTGSSGGSSSSSSGGSSNNSSWG